MKIIRPGQKLIRVYQISCRCGCIFEFTKDDPAIKTRPNWIGPKPHYIDCPECGNRFYFTNFERYNEV